MEQSYKVDSETLKLMAFHMIRQNNAMLREIMAILASVHSKTDYIDKKNITDDQEVQFTRQYEDLMAQRATLRENGSLKQSWEWAVTSNPGLDRQIELLFS